MKSLTLLFTFMVLASCSVGQIKFGGQADPIHYRSTSVNAALISNKGEAHISASYSPQYGKDVQASVGITKNISAILNYNSYSRSKEELPGTWGNKDYYIRGESKFNSFETGLGYYTKLSEKAVFEAYGLFGFGKIKHNYFTDNTAPENSGGNLNADFLKTGVQLNCGKKAKNYAVVMSLRALNLQFSNIEGDFHYREDNQKDYLLAYDNHWLVEPALTFRGGIKNVQLQLQFGGSINLTHDNFRQNKAFLNVGMNVLFNREL